MGPVVDSLTYWVNAIEDRCDVIREQESVKPEIRQDKARHSKVPNLCDSLSPFRLLVFRSVCVGRE